MNRTTNVFREAWAVMLSGLGTWGAYALLALLAALAMAPGLVPAALVMFLVLLVMHHRRSLRWTLRSSWRGPLPWLALYFLLHVAGMAWTTDMDFGLFDLQVKLPLLVFPVVAMLLPRMARVTRDAVLLFSALVNAVAVLFYLLASIHRIIWGSDHEVAQEVFSARFSYLVHPSYFAMYLVLSLAGWLLMPALGCMPRRVGLPVLVLLCSGVVLSGSKMGWIMLVLVLTVPLLLRWSDRSLRSTLLVLMGATATGLLVLVLASPYARSRVQEALQAATAAEVDDSAETSSAVRRITWSAAYSLFKEDPWLGTGTGDIKNELLGIYARRGQSWVLEHRLNAHSQFLQSLACLGVFGGLLLLMVLLAPLPGCCPRDMLPILFLLICALNWSVESMLEVQAGVVWTALYAWALFHTAAGAASPPSTSP